MRSILLCGVAAMMVFAAEKGSGKAETKDQTKDIDASVDADQSGNVLDAPADIAPATEVDTSGAPQQIVPDVDLSHPAVDANPRAGTTVEQNRIDFNDPTLTGQQAVEKALAKQVGADKSE